MPFLIFGQIPSGKAVTGVDVQWLITNEGFIQKNTFANTSLKCFTKAEVLSALYLDDSGVIDGKTANQLVVRNDLVKPVGGIKPFMRTDPGTNIETQADKGYPTIHMLHDGVFILPEMGDFIYNEDGTAFTTISENSFYGAQLYPSVGEDELNFRVNYLTGEVIWIGWVTDDTSTPTGLSYTNTAVAAFDLKWYGHTRYKNIRYFLERKKILPAAEDEFYLQQEVTNDQSNDGHQYSINFTAQDKAYWRVRAVATSSGNHDWFDKVSAEIIVTPLASFCYDIGDTGQASQPCDGSTSLFDTVCGSKDLVDISVGDYFYTDSNLTIAFVGNNNWYRSSGDTYAFRVGGDGYVSGVATCP